MVEVVDQPMTDEPDNVFATGHVVIVPLPPHWTVERYRAVRHYITEHKHVYMLFFNDAKGEAVVYCKPGVDWKAVEDWIHVVFALVEP